MAMEKYALLHSGKAWYPVGRSDKERMMQPMEQTTQPAPGQRLESLRDATDTLSTLLAQEVRALSTRQEDPADPGTVRSLKEATAVLKDLAAVARALNEQGTDRENTVCGVVLLPAVETG